MDKEMVDVVNSVEKNYGSLVMIIRNDADDAAAKERLVEIKGVMKTLEVKRLEMTRPLDESKRTIMDFFRKPIEILERAEMSIKQARNAYLFAVLDKQKKLQEEANRKAEIERKKLEARAEKAESSGKAEKAEDLRTAAQEVAPAIIEVKKPTGFRTDYVVEIVDEMAIPRIYLIPDLSYIDHIVREKKGKIEIPGVKITEKHTAISR